jgi:3-isopropylmalate/(R)-2-methylmalate dehydratase small subunit
MKSFITHTGLVAPLDRVNVDTDQMVPKQFLKALTRQGFGRILFYDWRYLPGEKPNPEFVLNFPRYKGASVLLARANFGCGSSREHAPIALAAAGVLAVVAEFYARIFYRNSVNGGYLIPLESKERLIDRICTGDKLVIDVTAGTLTNTTSGDSFTLLPLGEVAPILEAGGLFPYARKAGMLGEVGH